MEIICINILNPKQGTNQLSTMKRGGSEILRTKSNKRISNEPEPQEIYIDGSKLKLARAELDILRNGKYTSNAEFDRHLGELGTAFDMTFRTLIPWFVHYDFSQTPSEVIQCIFGLCDLFCFWKDPQE